MSSDDDYQTPPRRIASSKALPDAYREQIWQTVSREWNEQVRHRRRVRAGLAWGGAGLGVAAALVAGVLIGRGSDVSGGGSEHDSAAAVIVAGTLQLTTAYRIALDEHFREAETLLALSGSPTEIDDELAGSARDLAARTRLLMDTSAGEDAELRAILLDLELLLVQISRLVDAPAATERQLVREGLEDSTVLPRLRRSIPERSEIVGI